MNTLLIFDLDGVITSEEAYWDAAGLTLHELLYNPRYWGLNGKHYYPVQTAEESRRVSRATLPEAQILALKSRAINSNWDTCYAAICLHLISLLRAWMTSGGQKEYDDAEIFPLLPWDADWLARFRRDVAGRLEYVKSKDDGGTWGADAMNRVPTGIAKQLDIAGIFALPVFRDAVGLELINRFDAYASDVLSHRVEGVFSRHSPFWEFCRGIFQEWYLGDELFAQTYGHDPAQSGKPGCIHFERPLLPIEQLRATLETLKRREYILGFATGRVYQEAAYPLHTYDLLDYFDERHICTYDAVERAEAQLRARSDQTLLSKPHAFQFLYALDPDYAQNFIHGNAAQSQLPKPFIVIGDSTSDILGGHAAGAITVAVLTGTRTNEARRLLARSQPDFIIDDITHLPTLLAHIDSLLTIQQLQFQEREKAEHLLRLWFARHMNLPAERVTLMPKAVSLNSFNGIYRSDGQDYFFKTHVEEQGILEEYYHAALLQQAGYHIVNPLRLVHQKEQQMVVYPVVQWPVMFDLMRACETGQSGDITPDMLVAAERRECERLLAIYSATLAPATAEQHAEAPIHQLFWHRLAGSRLTSFYVGKSVPLLSIDNNTSKEQYIAFDDLLRYRWIIQGQAQPHTLGELIERGKMVLHPAQEAMTIIGHGDAHFGNVFLENRRDYLYFDPAFVGRHSPLLDVVKPLYHNVFATWMYFPQEIARDLHLTVEMHDETITVEHDYTPAPARQAILATKWECLLQPILTELRKHHALPVYWQEILQLALMCCPLLTINLLDKTRYSPVITWLGFTHAVLMGNNGIGLVGVQ